MKFEDFEKNFERKLQEPQTLREKGVQELQELQILREKGMQELQELQTLREKGILELRELQTLREEQRQQEEQRRLDEQRQLEEQRRLDEQRQLEEQRRLEEQRQQEEQRRLDEQQKQREEQRRLDEQKLQLKRNFKIKGIFVYEKQQYKFEIKGENLTIIDNQNIYKFKEETLEIPKNGCNFIDIKYIYNEKQNKVNNIKISIEDNCNNDFHFCKIIVADYTQPIYYRRREKLEKTYWNLMRC